MMLFERLDARVLYASISGRIWTDADGSTTLDRGESGRSGTVVFLDTNANGTLDRSETRTKADANGNYRFDGLAVGEYLVGIVNPTTDAQTTPGPTGTAKGTFDIDLAGTEKLTPEERRAFATAARRWESVITTDLPGIGGIDDIRITVSIEEIDGTGGTLAQAAPDSLRSGSRLPYHGTMEFDADDVPGMIEDGTFVDTVTHEMAHVLGFGTIWSDLGLIEDSGGDAPTFTGELATAAYNRLFGVREAGVPVEAEGGDGTADSHWPEDSFVEELMTGYAADPGLVVPISAITVAQFADLGYAVDFDAADTWNPYRHRTTLATPLDLGGVSYERRIIVANERNAENVNFGLRANTAPRIGRFFATSVTLGESTRLNASDVVDAEGDAVTAVTFYGESNGRAGLQRGTGGDLFMGATTVNRDGVWSVTAPTAGLAAGRQAFYALATDAIGDSRRTTTAATLTAPPPPTRPNPIVTTRQSRTTTLLQWRDRSDNEIGFRIEIATDPNYADVLTAVNVPAGTAARLLEGLTRGTMYYVRVRAYGYGGASAYTRLSGVRV